MNLRDDNNDDNLAKGGDNENYNGRFRRCIRIFKRRASLEKAKKKLRNLSSNIKFFNIFSRSSVFADISSK